MIFKPATMNKKLIVILFVFICSAAQFNFLLTGSVCSVYSVNGYSGYQLTAPARLSGIGNELSSPGQLDNISEKLKKSEHLNLSLDTGIISNNTDSAVNYFGKWRLTRNAPGFYRNDYRASNIQYNRCMFTFRGPYIKWYGSKNNNHGLADVFIDDIFQKTIDSYDSLLRTNVLLFEKSGLESGQLHILTIVVKKDKNIQSIDSYQDVDFFVSVQPCNYNKELTDRMEEEYRNIQEGVKPYALPAVWKPILCRTSAPMNNVSLQPGLFRDAFMRNLKYLNHCFASPTYCDGTGWSDWLPASEEGRMLSGAANSLRWVKREDMQRILDTVIHKIKTRARADGYHNYYSENQSFILTDGMNSERKNYDRVFWTRGLIDAGQSEKHEAYEIVRNFYNWFNSSGYLPNMLLGSNSTNGLPGGGLVYNSSVGKPDDLIVTERYFDQDYWMDGLSNGQPLCISNYPGERPHCYELLGLEAFLDEYLATGMQKYLDAVEGGWKIYNEYFEHTGGSSAICEGDYFPPKSFYLNSHTGETCGSVFWININEKLLHLFPEEEKYAAEIEKSIYNVILAAQDTNGYIRYHNNLHGQKDKSGCSGTCCEVSSVGLIAKLPEFIFSLADDGIYVNLFTASSISWNHDGGKMMAEMETGFPYDNDVTMIISPRYVQKMKVRIRIPSWLKSAIPVYVNGKIFGSGKPGTYLVINRTWHNNDKITFALPLSFTTVKYTGLDQINGNLDRYALLYGPFLMALQGPLSGFENVPWINVTPADLPGMLESLPGNLLKFSLKGYTGYSYAPYWQVQGVFTSFPIVQKKLKLFD